MNSNIKTFIVSAALLAMLSAGCRSALDVNQNPNIATNATPELLLPSAEVQIASAVGVDMQIYGSFWAQYWTQSPAASQYRDIERYSPAAADFNNVWQLLYSGALKDLQQTQVRAAAEGRNHYVGISKLLTAYTFQMITDAWGDVPFSEALQGSPSEALILSPRYDAQEMIYNNIINMVDTAVALLNMDDPNPPGSDDLVYGGDAESWIAFGNTLKLRMLLRISYKDPGKASAGIGAMSGPFLEEGQDAQIAFSATAGNRNPLAAEIQALNYTTNAVASKTSIDSLLANNDPRIDVFYEPSESGQIGLQQGNYNATPGIPISQPGAITGANSNLNTVSQIVAGRKAAVKLLTSYEAYFLRAEASARKFLPANTQDLFESGIRANFSVYGLPDSAADDYIANSYWGQFPATTDEDAMVRHIITQKWFSMNGTQGFEAWTEWRRTGYPNFFAFSQTSLIGQNRPVRFFYPSVELTRNQNFPGQKTITEKVWWDVIDR